MEEGNIVFMLVIGIIVVMIGMNGIVGMSDEEVSGFVSSSYFSIFLNPLMIPLYAIIVVVCDYLINKFEKPTT